MQTNKFSAAVGLKPTPPGNNSTDPRDRHACGHLKGRGGLPHGGATAASQSTTHQSAADVLLGSGSIVSGVGISTGGVSLGDISLARSAATQSFSVGGVSLGGGSISARRRRLDRRGGVSIGSGSLGVGVSINGASLGDLLHGSSSLGCSSNQQRCRRLDGRRLYPLAVRSVVT